LRRFGSGFGRGFSFSFGRFRGSFCFRFSWSSGFGFAIAQADEGRAEEFSLEGVTGRHRFIYRGPFRGRWLAIHELMAAGIELFVRGGNKWRQTDAPGDVVAGGAEPGDLLDHVRLAGLGGGAVQGVDMVKDPHEHLQPIGFHAAQLVYFQAQSGFLAVIGFLDELVEELDFVGHPLGDFLGLATGFISGFMN